MNSFFYQMNRSYFLVGAVSLAAAFILNPTLLFSDEIAGSEQPKKVVIPAPLTEITKKAIALNTQKTLFLDTKEKCLYLQGTISLNAGLLEMLCCKKQSKEHESIVSVNCKAYSIHAGLLALKAKPGKPVSFAPKYQAPTGEKIEITAIYVDEKGKVQQRDAKKWVRTITRKYFVTPLEVIPEDLTIPEDSELKYDHRRKELLHFSTLSAEEMKRLKKLSQDKKYHQALETIYKESQPHFLKADWVFAGSQFQKDEQTGKQQYVAEVGDLICVANFQSAMIDIAIQSSASDAIRAYEANSDLVPAAGTIVLLKLQRATDAKK